MKRVKRIIALVTATVMALSLYSPTAFGAERRTETEYAQDNGQFAVSHEAFFNDDTRLSDICIIDESVDNYITVEKSIYAEKEPIDIFLVVKGEKDNSDFQIKEQGFRVEEIVPRDEGVIISLVADSHDSELKVTFMWEDSEHHEMSFFGVRRDGSLYVSPFSFECCYDEFYHELYNNREITFSQYEEAMISIFTKTDTELYSEAIYEKTAETDNGTRAGTTVSGTIRWKDDSNNYHPLQYTKVIVYDDTTSATIGSAYTDASGHYSVYSPYSASKIYIRVSAQTTYVKATTANNVIYGLDSASYNCSGVVTVNMDFSMASNAGQAIQLLQGANTLARYAAAMGGYTLDQIRIKYPRTDGVTGFSYNDPNKTINAYQYVGGSLNSYASWDVIMHEYGHYLEYKIGLTGGYGGSHSITNDLASPPFSYDKQKSINLAWSESWNTVIAVMAQMYYASSLSNIYTVGDTSYTSYNSLNFNLETSSYKLGECCEASVMGFLYDLYDSNSDSFDNVSLGHNTFWNYSRNSGAKTANAFIQYLITHNYINENGLGNLLMNHGFSVGNIQKSGSSSSPVFTWTTQNSTVYPNNLFVIRFLNGSNTVIKSYTVNTNSKTISSSDWTSIKNSSGSYIRMKIVAYQTNSPSTGGFPSVIKQYPNS